MNIYTPQYVFPSKQIMTTAVVPGMLFPVEEIDTGINESYPLQKQMTEYLLLRVLDKWLFEDELCTVLKFFKVENGKVSLIKNQNDFDKNKICNDKTEDIEKKADYIEENYLGMSQMRKILRDIVVDHGIKWYDLCAPYIEPFVVKAVKKYLKDKLKNDIPAN